VFDQVFEELKGLQNIGIREELTDGDDTDFVDLPPLPGFFFHESRIDTGHYFVEMLASIQLVLIS
jgi:hypothetical protein